jgi:hypothetical protein
VLVSTLPAVYVVCASSNWGCATINLAHLGFERFFVTIVSGTEKLLLATGILLLGVATLGARVLGRWKALPLVVAVLTVPWATIIVLSLGLTQVPWLLLGLFATLRNLSWVLLGGVLRFHGTREDPAVSQGVSTT